MNNLLFFLIFQHHTFNVQVLIVHLISFILITLKPKTTKHIPNQLAHFSHFDTQICYITLKERNICSVCFSFPFTQALVVFFFW